MITSDIVVVAFIFQAMKYCMSYISVKQLAKNIFTRSERRVNTSLCIVLKKTVFLLLLVNHLCMLFVLMIIQICYSLTLLQFLICCVQLVQFWNSHCRHTYVCI